MNRRPAAQAFLGVVIVLIGVLALLSQLDVVTIDLGDLISTWWPLVIVGIGLVALVTVPRAWVGPTIIIAVGAFLLLMTTDVVDVDFWQLAWPVAIILVGVALLTRLGTQEDHADTVNSTVMWWGSQRRTRSQTFRGGSLTAIMGGIDVDLRDAAIVSDAEISVFVMWGGVDITVPPTWRVRLSGLPLLGGWDDKTTPPVDPHAPELRIHITSVMGGVDVENKLPRSLV
ncbi:conserved hypothetical protein [Beutenbergia cavernae DSM 12333]|uniref:LiaF transmembrane domain-containing protein n=1 Tax=Beutenbergia cavernae (strain ATCC BAA-8 / DSM 12333 / CCUG 43141 / JCM 11478 / NBRC 16432 / NCIMB 13614 / HKI 0122) TaxID=471853 RepID=C5C6G5_BEUC1|nr:DUF5668 domain-containing protein [Beutenbergia cavernae]ACQ80371.1 conserved hypothetical protein [Beutenbergia cavernae DSM 12333]